MPCQLGFSKWLIQPNMDMCADGNTCCTQSQAAGNGHRGCAWVRGARGPRERLEEDLLVEVRAGTRRAQQQPVLGTPGRVHSRAHFACKPLHNTESAYKALHNTESASKAQHIRNLHTKHYTIRNICKVSLVFSALYAK